MSCPNGYICLNKVNSIFILAFILIVLYFVNREFYGRLYSKVDNLEKDNNNRILSLLEQQKSQPTINIPPPQIIQQIPQSQQTQEQPTRPRGLPINIETRGSGGEFKQKGLLYKENVSSTDQEPGNNSSTIILPLYGKPTYRGSNDWYYYTTANEHINVRISLTVNGKDSMDMGIREINDGDSVTIKEYNGTFKFKKNFDDKPRYIPYI